MSTPKVLLSGATGYIGGSVLSTLLETKNIPKDSISVLVRGDDKAKALKALGVNVVLFNNLDEAELLQRVASEHDIVIHTASGYHTVSAKALVLGLGDRKRKTGKDVHYIHTSGTSNLGDQPITGKYLEERTFSDKDNIYAYEKTREALQPYAQRTTDIVIVETGLEVGVLTHIIMSPTIYGVGTGHFNKLSIQAPGFIRTALKLGKTFVIGNGKGTWDYVHIADLTKLYEIVLQKILKGEEGKIPSGEQGILFSESGRFLWRDFSQGIADALHTLGALKTKEVEEVDVTTAAEKLGWDSLTAELAYASNSRTQSDIGRELGWKPVKTEQDFKNHFLEEAQLIIS